MSVVTRGVKNAFRNWLRTLAVVLILAIGMGLSFSMSVANEAIAAKINSLKAYVGTTLMVHPAGARGGEGGGEPLTMSQVEAVSKVAHVTHVAAIAHIVLQNQDSQNQMLKMRGGMEPGKTNLTSPVQPGTLGKRSAGVQTHGALPENFSMPIQGVGSQGTDANGKAFTITEGRNLSKDDTGYVAVVGKELAAKNLLNVGSTFTAYDQTFTVVGIFDQGTTFENAGLAIPLSVAQTLTEMPDEVGSMAVTVDSIDNLTATQAAITAAQGADKADVTSSQANIQGTLDSLKSVQQVSITAFVGALVAAAVIIFLIMLMVVRERKREIGAPKAIGGSNRTVVSQFMVEALVLAVLGTVVGLGLALVSSGSIANALVSSNAGNNQNALQTQTSGPGLHTVKMGPRAQDIESTVALVGHVATSVGWSTVSYAFLAAVAIAIVGSAIPAWLIAKVRPAVVMRGE